MTLLSTRGLTRRFGGLCAVDGVDLELGEREILGVIGPNGAGKTTLFSLIAGSIRPTSGEIVLDGVRVTGLPAHRCVRAGIVRTHQIVRPFGNVTVLENVQIAAIHARGAATGHARDRAAEVLDFVGLAGREGQYPGMLTLAGRKRLELARALSTGPRVLLLDEVVAGVNPTEAMAFAALIRRIRDERGISVIMTEHVMPAVMSLSDRIFVLDRGKPIAVGTPQQVVTDPRVITAYLGTAPDEAPDGARLPPRETGPTGLQAPSPKPAGTSEHAAGQPLLEIDQIDVFYDDVQVLHGLRLEVRRGEIVTLLGSNGAGKSTTLRAIMGLCPPRSGDIRFLGQPLAAVPAAGRAELGIALVPEGRELWPQLTVRENLLLGAYTRRGRRNAGRTLQRMFALFPRLEERQRQAAGSLSGGEQQMCAIARALMSEPTLLMLDELSLGLAPVLVDQLMQTITELHAGGMTILLVEQNLRKALGIAQRGVIIETGRLRLAGTSAELADNPEIRAAYLGI